MPLASVVVVASTVVPVPSSKRTVTPGIPGSPASCKPLAFRSLNTKSPKRAFEGTKPASTVRLVWPLVKVTG